MDEVTSTKENILKSLTQACLNCDPEAAREVANEAIRLGVDPVEAIEKGLVAGIREIGEKFERREAFLPELVMGAEAMKEGIKILESKIPAGKEIESLGTVIIGTVQSDIHDVGKNIAATMLRANGFKVYDLGVDVPTDTFIEKVKELRPDIVGLSALMTITLPMQKKVINALKQAGLREKVKVIIGGAPVNEEWAREIGANGYADNAIEGVRIAKKLVGKLRRK